jgi:hypothetical protein
MPNNYTAKDLYLPAGFLPPEEKNASPHLVDPQVKNITETDYRDVKIVHPRVDQSILEERSHHLKYLLQMSNLMQITKDGILHM